MSVHRNNNYNIGVDTLPDGRVMARAHGRKKNVKTFPVDTTHLAAALELASKLQPNDLSHVQLVSGVVGWKSDWAIYVGFGD